MMKVSYFGSFLVYFKLATKNAVCKGKPTPQMFLPAIAPSDQQFRKNINIEKTSIESIKFCFLRLLSP